MKIRYGSNFDIPTTSISIANSLHGMRDVEKIGNIFIEPRHKSNILEKQDLFKPNFSMSIVFAMVGISFIFYGMASTSFISAWLGLGTLLLSIVFTMKKND